MLGARNLGGAIVDHLQRERLALRRRSLSSEETAAEVSERGALGIAADASDLDVLAARSRGCATSSARRA